MKTRAWKIAAMAVALLGLVVLLAIAIRPRGTSYVGTWRCESKRVDCAGIPEMQIRDDGTFDWGPYRGARWEEEHDAGHWILHLAPDENGWDCIAQIDGGGEFRRNDAGLIHLRDAERCDRFVFPERTDIDFRRTGGRPWSDVHGPAWKERAPGARSAAAQARDRGREAARLGCWAAGSHEFPVQPGTAPSPVRIERASGAPEPIGAWTPAGSARMPIEWFRTCFQDLGLAYTEAQESRYQTPSGKNDARRFETADWTAVAFNSERVTLRLPVSSAER